MISKDDIPLYLMRQMDCRNLIAQINKAIIHLGLIRKRIVEEQDLVSTDRFYRYRAIVDQFGCALEHLRTACMELLNYHDMMPQPKVAPKITFEQIRAWVQKILQHCHRWQYSNYCAFSVTHLYV